MAVLNTKNPTLMDVSQRMDPDGTIADIVELLGESNEVLIDMTSLEGNLPVGHKTTVRTGLPEPTWRKLYGFVPSSKSETTAVTDSCGMLVAYSVVDQALADLNGNTAAFRLTEDAAHIEGMSQEMASTLFYGNESSEPAAFTGLSPRYNSLSAQNADNVIDAFSGSGGDLTSIWLCVWGPSTGFGIYPKGSKAGLQMEDKGQVTIDSAEGSMEAYRTHYRWDLGLCVRDWRYFVRIANIDISELNTVANTKNLVHWMVQASERIPSFGKGRAAFYMNRTLREKLRLGILERVSSNLSWDTVEGKRVLSFDDIPVRRTDALINTESRVV